MTTTAPGIPRMKVALATLFVDLLAIFGRSSAHAVASTSTMTVAHTYITTLKARCQ